MNRFYVTTPIYYVSDKPHIGHAYTTVAADVLARHYRQKLGDDRVFFLTGTDEHGQKVAEAAAIKGKEPQQFVDELAQVYADLWQRLGISHDFFIRTTDPAHESYAKQFIQDLYDKGQITKGEYAGLYCVGHEAFLTEKELVDGRCPEHPNKDLVPTREQNYFFALSQWTPKVRELIEQGAIAIEPANRRNEILARLSEPIHDISLSRKAVTWGIPIPWDIEQTIYVWFEALLNYASALTTTGKEEFWPPTIQLMGKEILWFHAVIWPAMLLAAGKELPKTIFGHGWFTVDGQKMSKTVGNVIDPVTVIDQYGVDATRYFLLTATTFGSDGDISEDRFARQYTADLANQLGNLLQRTLVLRNKFAVQVAAETPSMPPVIAHATEACEFDRALAEIWLLIRAANTQLDLDAPWAETDAEKRTHTLTWATRQLETIAVSLYPYLPETASTITAQLVSGNPVPLFPRIET